MAEVVWTVVIPVKRLSAAKTRLRGALAPAAHEKLALALAADTIAAARQVADVIVVTDDVQVAATARALGAQVVPEPALRHELPRQPGHRPTAPDPQSGMPGGPGADEAKAAADAAAGLNAALAYGADRCAPAAQRWRAALAADLPALRPAELVAALRAAAGSVQRRFVPDAAEVGTVLLTAPPGMPLAPRFGGRSAAAHAASGAARLDGDWPGLRRDVDTAADLRAAQTLGIGPHTTRAIRDQEAVVGGSRHTDGAAGPHRCKIERGTG